MRSGSLSFASVGVALLLWATLPAAFAQAPPPPPGTPLVPPPLPAPIAAPPPIALPPPLPASDFYVAQNGQSTGPMTIDDVRKLVTTGALAASTLVWKSGTPNWVAAQQLPELAGLFPPAAAAQAAPAPPLPPQSAPPASGQQALTQPGFNQPSPPLANVSPNVPNYADESTDFGISPQNGLQTNVGSPTPMTIPGGRVVTTQDLANALRTTNNLVLIDVLANTHTTTVPGATRLSYAGRAGTMNDQVERMLANDLKRLTRNRKDAQIVMFCLGSQCWESYNAVLRAEALGYTNVFWYRGGLDAWQAAGLPMTRVSSR